MLAELRSLAARGVREAESRREEAPSRAEEVLSLETISARSSSSSASPRFAEPPVSLPATNPPSPTARQAALTLVAFHFMSSDIRRFFLARNGGFQCRLVCGRHGAIFAG